jgi:hypothetical protein
MIGWMQRKQGIIPVFAKPPSCTRTDRARLAEQARTTIMADSVGGSTSSGKKPTKDGQRKLSGQDIKKQRKAHQDRILNEQRLKKLR